MTQNRERSFRHRETMEVERFLEGSCSSDSGVGLVVAASCNHYNSSFKRLIPSSGEHRKQHSTTIPKLAMYSRMVNDKIS